MTAKGKGTFYIKNTLADIDLQPAYIVGRDLFLGGKYIAAYQTFHEYLPGLSYRFSEQPLFALRQFEAVPFEDHATVVKHLK